jgi:hypothetical protein
MEDTAMDHHIHQLDDRRVRAQLSGTTNAGWMDTWILTLKRWRNAEFAGVSIRMLTPFWPVAARFRGCARNFLGTPIRRDLFSPPGRSTLRICIAEPLGKRSVRPAADN